MSQIIGVVLSKKMTKTVVVQVKRTERQPIYGKYVTKVQKMLVHDEEAQCKIGDKVLIQSCKPFSKRKSWVVLNILTA